MTPRFAQRLAVTAMFLAGPLLYAEHLAEEAGRPVCDACAARVSAGCNEVCCAGGCGDATHHHHDPAHHREQCAICKAAPGLVAIVAAAVPGSPAIDAAGWSPARVPPQSRPSALAHTARAPPPTA